MPDIFRATRRNGRRTPFLRARRSVAMGLTALALSGAPAMAGTALHDALGAPDELTIKGMVRSRVEGIDGQFRPNMAESDFLWSLKTTLLVDYDGGPLRIGGELWDARGYGEKQSSSAGTSEINALELIQAYVGFDVALSDKANAALTAGRFTMDIGSRRLVGRQTFRNTTNGFTGANLVVNGKGGDRLVLFWTLPQIRLPEDHDGIFDNGVKWDKESSALQFFGGSLTKGGVLGGTLELYAYGLKEEDRADRLTRNRRLWTPGLRAWRKPRAGQVDYDLEAAYQFGKTRATTRATDLTDMNVSAWLVHAEAGRTWPAKWQPRLSVDFDLATGDKGNARSYNRFDTLYGPRRFDFGPTGLYGPVHRYNVVSGGVRLEAKPGKSSDVMAMYRALWLESKADSFSATNVKDGAGDSGRFAGHQFEARLRRWLIPDLLRVDTGLAYLVKGRFLTDAANAPRTGDTRYGYVDLYLEF
ncbi:alginate export family protein [Sphingobium lactosutens]|uniref:alginate export family protein n=1 Tax=Sphingobium lactosutens TaxID=522773 RepID=UPI0015C1B0BE|nr:alginate export family protein [Sphingobium lactosutens]NWK98910.1 alginate export family protein [Sphingobium lactosutens]